MKQRSKKSLKLTDAVVRGAKNSYEFEVFPIQTEFEPQSAVYIFSERKIDKKGRGHQKFVFIGQTPSLDGEFSKYKKSFASKYNANVICVYIEENETSRIKIEEELKNAYSISCANNISEKKIKAKPVKTDAPQAAESVQSKAKITEPKKTVEKTKSIEKTVRSPKAAKSEKSTVKSKISKPKSNSVSSKVENKKKTVKPAKSNGKKLAVKPVKSKKRVQKSSKPKVKVQNDVKTTKTTHKRLVKKVKANAATDLKNNKPKGKTAKSNGKSNGKSLNLSAKTNSKQQPASNKKPAVRKQTASNKNQGSKQTSRKQLAF